MAKTVHRLDEEEKKIIDLIRQMKIDFQSTKLLLYYGLVNRVDVAERAKIGQKDKFILEMVQRDLDKYTKLLEALEKGE